MGSSVVTKVKSEDKEYGGGAAWLRRALLAGVATWAFLLPHGSFAQQAPAAQQPLAETPSELLFTADEIINDRDLGVVVARGNVQVAAEDRYLQADTLTYNQRTETVSASGNVILHEPDGSVFFTEYAELTSDMKSGVIREIRYRMQGTARMAADSGRRSNGNRTDLSRAVYTLCDVCKDNPDGEPFWQLRARQVTHDQTEQWVEYRHVTLDIMGVPVLYSPYFGHYDNTVTRKSGFLIPSAGSNDGLGFFVRPAYFWAIDDSKDLTVNPILGEEGRAIMSGEYRQAFDFGELRANTSFGDLKQNLAYDPQNSKFRGHVDLEGVAHLDETWRASGEFIKATDRTYLLTYPLFGYSGERIIRNRARLEGFRDRSYFLAQSRAYDELGSSSTTGIGPDVPLEFYFDGVTPDSRYGRFDISAWSAMINRSDGADTQRISATPGYEVNSELGLGVVGTARADVQTDLFVTEREAAAGFSQDDETDGRAHPAMSLAAQMPWVRYDGTVTETITPKIIGRVAPSTEERLYKRNEDFIDYEVGLGSVTAHDMLGGADVVEPGARVGYGLDYMAQTGPLGAGLNIGQYYRPNGDREFRELTGIDKGFSDVVLGANLNWDGNYTIGYQTAVNNLTDYDTRYRSINASLTQGDFSGSVSYVFADDAFNGNLATGHTEYASANVEYGFDEFFKGQFAIQHDLNEGETRDMLAMLSYGDECTVVQLSFRRTFYNNNPEVSGRSDTYLLSVSLLTLGEQIFDLGP